MMDKMFFGALILFFILLIGALVFHEIKRNFSVIEGLKSDESGEYKEYDANDPMILSQQNAGNIAVLKKQMDELLALKQDVYDMSLNMVEMSGQINDFADSQKQTSDDTIGTEDPNITGATDEPPEEEDAEDAE
jgi:hypothetical protein